MFRPPGAAGVGETPVALPGTGLCSEDLDRDRRGDGVPGVVDPPGSGRGDDPGRSRRPPAAEQGRRFGVAWDTIHQSVEEFGHPWSMTRPGSGSSGSSGWMRPPIKTATPERATQFVTGMIDLDRRIVIDMIEGRQGTDLRRWLLKQSVEWRKKVRVVATDLTDAYRRGMTGLLDHSPQGRGPVSRGQGRSAVLGCDPPPGPARTTRAPRTQRRRPRAFRGLGVRPSASARRSVPRVSGC